MIIVNIPNGAERAGLLAAQLAEFLLMPDNAGHAEYGKARDALRGFCAYQRYVNVDVPINECCILSAALKPLPEVARAVAEVQALFAETPPAIVEGVFYAHIAQEAQRYLNSNEWLLWYE